MINVLYSTSNEYVMKDPNFFLLLSPWKLLKARLYMSVKTTAFKQEFWDFFCKKDYSLHEQVLLLQKQTTGPVAQALYHLGEVNQVIQAWSYQTSCYLKSPIVVTSWRTESSNISLVVLDKLIYYSRNLIFYFSKFFEDRPTDITTYKDASRRLKT